MSDVIIYGYIHWIEEKVSFCECNLSINMIIMCLVSSSDIISQSIINFNKSLIPTLIYIFLYYKIIFNTLFKFDPLVYIFFPRIVNITENCMISRT